MSLRSCDRTLRVWVTRDWPVHVFNGHDGDDQSVYVQSVIFYKIIFLKRLQCFDFEKKKIDFQNFAN